MELSGALPTVQEGGRGKVIPAFCPSTITRTVVSLREGATGEGEGGTCVTMETMEVWVTEEGLEGCAEEEEEEEKADLSLDSFICFFLFLIHLSLEGKKADTSLCRERTASHAKSISARMKLYFRTAYVNSVIRKP